MIISQPVQRRRVSKKRGLQSAPPLVGPFSGETEEMTGAKYDSKMPVLVAFTLPTASERARHAIDHAVNEKWRSAPVIAIGKLTPTATGATGWSQTKRAGHGGEARRIDRPPAGTVNWACVVDRMVTVITVELSVQTGWYASQLPPELLITLLGGNAAA